MSSHPEFAFAAVAAPHAAAAAAGQAILAQGGDALQAMVAMAATAAVVCPHTAGLGGDAVWLIREPGGKARCIEAFGAAGAQATIRRYFKAGHEKTIPRRGPLAALTVPGAVAGLAQALAFSTARGAPGLSLADLLRDAIRHAREGAPVAAAETRTPVPDELKKAPGFAHAFLADGAPPKAGDMRRQETLADTLDHLAHAGLMDFYRGDVGREIAADLARIGAPVTRADLRKQNARWPAPFSVRLRDVTVFNAPPPAQGLASLMILGICERLNIARAGDFEHIHAIVEAAKRAFAVRERECADFEWPTSDPERWLAADALEREALAISMSRAAPSPVCVPDFAGVWMGAIDTAGLAVSCAHSPGQPWGSGCLLPATGVLMSNCGQAFSLDAASPQALHPGRRPMHMLNAPLAAFDDGRVAVFGATGGDAGPQVQAQVFAHARSGANPGAGVDAPRFFHGCTPPVAAARLNVEDGFDPSLVRALERAGHEVAIAADGERDAFGEAGLLIRARAGRILAACDPRTQGGAAGL